MSGFSFTDRYGAAGAPAYIRGCHGGCEAMGFYPTTDQSEWPASARAVGVPEEDGTPDDEWRFVKCRKCNGTGRVSWMRSLLRIPRWVWKGIRTWPHISMIGLHEPAKSTISRHKVAFWCCFGADLKRLQREIFQTRRAA